MNLKKKQCSGTKGYSCGRSCISVKKVCRKDGLTGQSVKLLNDFVKEIGSVKPAPAPKPVAKAAPEPAPEPVAKAAPKPVAKAAPEPAPEPVAKAAPEPAPAPKPEPAPAPKPEPAPAPKPEPAPAPKPEPAPAPAPAPVAKRDVQWGKEAKELYDLVTKEIGPKLQKYGMKNVAPMTDREAEAIGSYTGVSSPYIRKHDAGVAEYDWLAEDVDVLNNLIDTYETKVERELYHGFSKDMAPVYGIQNLKPGSEFSFPSITSLSAAKGVAKSFNGKGIFVIQNKKYGAPIAAMSTHTDELEVLINKKAKYKVSKIEGKNIFLDEVYD